MECWSVGLMPKMTNVEWRMTKEWLKCPPPPLCYGAQANADLILGVWELLWSLGPVRLRSGQALEFWSFCAIATFLTRKDRFWAYEVLGRGACAQELADFVLHVFHFIKTELRIADYENVAAGAVFVNQDRAIPRFLGFDLFQNAFAL